MCKSATCLFVFHTIFIDVINQLVNTRYVLCAGQAELPLIKRVDRSSERDGAVHHFDVDPSQRQRATLPTGVGDTTFEVPRVFIHGLCCCR